ncbi:MULTISPECIES: chromate transporter [unclassified Bordetella]|uniref:chromate transporter n=1 Tax=unclassified Bordetella TaxID=2630031 RepID=UPI0013206AAB|nr:MULTISPECIES: chromate transporter [unclassified Bordetella]MVW70894.1 chromate transporter [Bordetella sp. 15P40C-2]MVW79509.1 chromate transporter [Bordetella sp. 02P26C-1]
MTSVLIALFIIFTQLSVLAFGGGNTILPEMQREVVEVHGWMTAAEFSALFALSQAAPGPNMMIVTLVGWQVAGWQGALVATIAKFGPSSILTGIALGLWERFKDKPWRGIVQTGIFPVTVGLVAASASLITEASVHTWLLGAITAIVAVVATFSRVHPLWLLALGGLVGLTGIGQP